jgi:hypothetical protein
MIREVDEPVVRNLRSGIQAALVVAIERERGFGHLQYQRRTGRMSDQVVAGTSRHHGDVRLRLALGDNRLYTDLCGSNGIRRRRRRTCGLTV